LTFPAKFAAASRLYFPPDGGFLIPQPDFVRGLTLKKPYAAWHKDCFLRLCGEVSEAFDNLQLRCHSRNPAKAGRRESLVPIPDKPE